MSPEAAQLLIDKRQYEGMTLEESRIVRAWLRRHAVQYDTIEFNVRLGPGVQLGEGFDDATRRAALLSTQKRADIIARRAAGATIVEAKPRIDFRGMGQLMGYRHMWIEDHPTIPVEQLVAIGFTTAEDILPIFTAQGIAVETFPDA
jgi:hypothetical protein